MSVKGKGRTRQARCDVLKATARARQRALAMDRTRAKPYDRLAYDGHQNQMQET